MHDLITTKLWTCNECYSNILWFTATYNTNDSNPQHSYVCKKKGKVIPLGPGVAQRVGRRIALIFHDCSTRRGWVVSSTPRPQEAGWVPAPADGRKISSPPGFDPGPSKPVVSRYTDWATRPTVTYVLCIKLNENCNKFNSKAYVRFENFMIFSIKLPFLAIRHLMVPNISEESAASIYQTTRHHISEDIKDVKQFFLCIGRQIAYN